MRTLTLTTALAIALSACSGDAPAPAPEQEEPAKEMKKEEAPNEEAKKEEPEAEPAGDAIVVGQDDGGEYPEVTLESDGNEMAYKQDKITLKADTKTRIIMKNNATSAAMKHNVVIVKAGTEDEVGQKGVSIGPDKDYVPADDPNVLAATNMSEPGETTTTTVELPAGEYAFICTFPGHYVLMRGKVIVEG